MFEPYTSISGPGVGIAWIYLLASIGAFSIYTPKSQADMDGRPGLVSLNPIIGTLSAVYLAYHMQVGWWIPILLAAVAAAFAAISLWHNNYRSASVWTWIIVGFDFTPVYRIGIDKQAYGVAILGGIAQIAVILYLGFIIYRRYKETFATRL